MASSIGLAQTAPTILVVEDEFLIRFMVADALRDAGFAVIEACDADEALEIAYSGVPLELIFSDVRMPGSIDGLGLLAQVRDLRPAVPVIITSGHLLPDEALSKGAAKFLGKPYTFDEAVDLIKSELGSS